MKLARAGNLQYAEDVMVGSVSPQRRRFGLLLGNQIFGAVSADLGLLQQGYIAAKRNPHLVGAGASKPALGQEDVRQTIVAGAQRT
jgi:hypothetical protein